MVKLFSLSIFFFGLSVLALESKPLRTIESKIVFQTKIVSPQFLTICGGKLWTYSVAQRTFWAIDLNKGTGKAILTLPNPGSSNTSRATNSGNEANSSSMTSSTGAIDVAAMSCQKDRLLVLINNANKAKTSEIIEFKVNSEQETLEKIRTFASPESNRTADFFCNVDRCWILQTKLYVTEDLKKWRNLNVPAIRDVPLIHRKPEENPFENWQASLVMARGRYTKGAVNSEGLLALLDPFHSHVVVHRSYNWEKWGSFGVWEGSLLSPKQMTFLVDQVLAVTDAQLHGVFLFRPDGLYLGVVALSEEKIFSPTYPLGLAALGDRIFIADFIDGVVTALDVSRFKSLTENQNEVSVRQNLIRRHDLPADSNQALCLQCHDGTQSNQLWKFAKIQYHHPVACAECHDPHHQIKSNHYLRKEPSALCLQCHKDHANVETNHVWKKANSKGGACLDCHKTHAEAPQLLLSQPPDLCVSCHQQQTMRHRPVQNFLNLDTAKDLKFDDNHITCFTCHQTHVSWKSEHFIKNKNQVLTFCSTCHGPRAPQLFGDFHRLMNTKVK